MKKVTALILAAVICLSLCACGKSEAVKNAEALITAIGEVTLDSESAIIAAEEAYAALTAEEKEQVENYPVLIDAKAGIVKILIDEIGEVTLDSKTAIVAAEKAYAALTAEGKEQVENYSVLIDARKKLDIELAKQPYLGSWYNPFSNSYMEFSEEEYGAYWSFDKNGSITISDGPVQAICSIEEYKGVVYLCCEGERQYVRPEAASTTEYTITTDNWQEFFTLENEVFSYYDDFGDLTLYGISVVIGVKDEYQHRLVDTDASITFEFIGTSGYRLGFFNKEDQSIHFADRWEAIHDEEHTENVVAEEWFWIQVYHYQNDAPLPYLDYARADYPNDVTVLDGVEYNRLRITADNPQINRVAGTLVLYDNPLYFD